jgi:hypothetical protein
LAKYLKEDHKFGFRESKDSKGAHFKIYSAFDERL